MLQTQTPCMGETVPEFPLVQRTGRSDLLRSPDHRGRGWVSQIETASPPGPQGQTFLTSRAPTQFSIPGYSSFLSPDFKHSLSSKPSQLLFPWLEILFPSLPRPGYCLLTPSGLQQMPSPLGHPSHPLSWVRPLLRASGPGLPCSSTFPIMC